MTSHPQRTLHHDCDDGDFCQCAIASAQLFHVQDATRLVGRCRFSLGTVAVDRFGLVLLAEGWERHIFI